MVVVRVIVVLCRLLLVFCVSWCAWFVVVVVRVDVCSLFVGG